MAQLRVPFDDRDYTGFLCIFDKDGTLIDFNAMWATWLIDLARQLQTACRELNRNPHDIRAHEIPERLFRAMDVDATSGRVIPGGHFAVEPMARLREITVETLRTAGLGAGAAEQIVDQTWYLPDPVALARPLADLPAIFGTLQARGIRIAVATSDDHAPTQATLASLGVAGLVDAIVGADDGLPNKPAPDMVLRLCRDLGVPPAQTAVVGDAVADMQMARAATVGLAIGVLSGLSSAALLAPYADVALPSIADLIA
jgi:phosphoglycolate phosphatase